ncbi:MAG: N-methyl-L-tryptophan oxidase [Vibrio sp.]
MQYDVIVIGAGSMGMATGYFLAKQGKRVLLLDAFDPPHSHASHHGETRIIRHAYGEGKDYVPLALRAQTLWEELEQESNRSIFLKTGVLNIGERTQLFISTLIDSAEEYQLPIEILNAEQANERYQGLNLPPEFIACLEPTSGVLRCENAIEAYRHLALEQGAELRTYSRVSAIKLLKDSVTVTAKGQEFSAKKLVVSVGAWSNDLLKMLDLSLPLSPVRKTFAWYNAPEAIYGEGHFPAFSWDIPEGIYYGFPSIDGAGLKIGRHDQGEAHEPNTPLVPFSEAKDAADLNQLLSRYMPQVGQLHVGKTCMYTRTPDEHFIIDHHPKHSHVMIASGFSGHGFKFASVVGEILTDMALDKSPCFDLSLFAIKRFQ